MEPPSAQSQAFDTTCSAWLGRWVDTIPLGFHRLLSDFRLLQLLPIDGRTKGALFDTPDLNGFWTAGLVPDFGLCRSAALPQPRHPRRPMRSPPREPHVVEVYAITRDTCGHHRCYHVSCRLAVSKVRLTLPNFYNTRLQIAKSRARRKASAFFPLHLAGACWIATAAAMNQWPS